MPKSERNSFGYPVQKRPRSKYTKKVYGKYKLDLRPWDTRG